MALIKALSQSGRAASDRVYRHSVAVRLMHWVNFVCLVILLMSGLQIFNAHPALYWGKSSHFTQSGFFGTPILSMYAKTSPSGHVIGVTQIGHHTFNTTGWFGLSDNANGVAQYRAFPHWATLPGPQWLAMGRHWHFFFAWILVANAFAFFLYSLFSGHLKRDLLPRRDELRQLGHSLVQHMFLRFPKGKEALQYNVLQKLAYLSVIFVLGPLIVLTGLTLSPYMDSVFPPLLWLFGGRQSARTLHFICAFSFVGFFILHMLMVVLSGVVNNLRSIITGYRRITTTENGQSK